MKTAWMTSLILAAAMAASAPAMSADVSGKWNWDKPQTPEPAPAPPIASPACDKPGPDGKLPETCAAPEPPHETGLEDSLSPPSPMMPSGRTTAQKLH
jgi:hypothetical protein